MACLLRLLLLAGCVLAASAGLLNINCPLGFTRLSEKSCYMVEKEAVSQQAARAACEKRGAVLAVLDDPQEYRRVNDWLRFRGKANVWMGLHATDSWEWVWDNGATFNASWWASNEPDQGVENAGHIWRDFDMHDRKDVALFKPLCQIIECQRRIEVGYVPCHSANECSQACAQARCMYYEPPSLVTKGRYYVCDHENMTAIGGGPYYTPFC